MLKKSKVYIFIGIFTLGLIFLVEFNKPKKINWFPSYVSHHKIPYGTYVLNDLLPELFDGKIRQVQRPPFEFLLRNDTIQGTYFFANASVQFGDTELEAVLDWVNKGNSVFIASESFDQQLLDTLNLERSSLYNQDELTPTFYHELTNPYLNSGIFPFEKDYYTPIFKSIDTINTVVLGEVHTRADSTLTPIKNVSVIKQAFGKGEIILSTFPKAFTNYFMLKDSNRTYTAGLLSYMNAANTIFIDNHHKSGKSFYTSPMYLFLNTKELKWAYYMVLIGALFYVIFEGKRKQRPIPIVNPLKNQTLAFTRTIADMYFENGEQKQITIHKIDYFLEYIRSKLNLSTQQLDDTFKKRLAVRSNNTHEDVKSLFKLIEQLQSKNQITDSELQKLNKKIEAFKAKVDGK